MKYIVLILCFFLTGCLSLFSDAETPQSLFLSEVKLSPCQKTSSIALQVQKSVMPEWLNSKHLFLKEGARITPLADIELIETSGDHVLHHLISSLRQSSLYKTVGSKVHSSYKLVPHIQSFWVEKESHAYKAVLSLFVELIHDDENILFQRLYTCDQSFSTWSQQPIVGALETVLHQCVNKLYSDLKGL